MVLATLRRLVALFHLREGAGGGADVGSASRLVQVHWMPQRLNLTTLLVDEYDTAVSFFVGKLGFELRENTALTDGERWIVVGPHGAVSGLLLARAVGGRQRKAVGNQSGGRVFLFLETDDFARDHLAYTQRGVNFVEAPRHEPYGIVAVFEDLYGNRWDLIEPVTVKGVIPD
jgi:catechol 2,3-dioxygenase-like lactoylglutathione lyase family enzyme